MDSSSISEVEEEILEVKVGVIAAGGKSRRQIVFEIVFSQAVMLKKESIFVHVN